MPVSRLTKIFRQGAGSGIIRNAQAVNFGHMPKPPTPESHALADFYWIKKDDPEEAAAMVERMPKRFGLNPLSDIQVRGHMNCGSCGTIALNQRLQAAMMLQRKVLYTGIPRAKMLMILATPGMPSPWT